MSRAGLTKSLLGDHPTWPFGSCVRLRTPESFAGARWKDRYPLCSARSGNAVKRPYSTGDIHGVSRRAQASSQRGEGPVLGEGHATIQKGVTGWTLAEGSRRPGPYQLRNSCGSILVGGLQSLRPCAIRATHARPIRIQHQYHAAKLQLRPGCLANQSTAADAVGVQTLLLILLGCVGARTRVQYRLDYENVDTKG